MDTVVLVGAEEVKQAANTMREAATEMSRAASSIYATLGQHQQFLEDYLSRFEAVLEQVQDPLVAEIAKSMDCTPKEAVEYAQESVGAPKKDLKPTKGIKRKRHESCVDCGADPNEPCWDDPHRTSWGGWSQPKKQTPRLPYAAERVKAVMKKEGVCPADLAITRPGYDGPEVTCETCPDNDGCEYKGE